MSNNKEADNLFWNEYEQELKEDLNFRLVFDWFDSGSPDAMLRVESIEFKGVCYRKKKRLKTIWYFIKRLIKKKRRKE